MDAERSEWVEIIEPRTKEHMYTNLVTGECVWDVPPGVRVKRTDDNQWWELFDSNTSRFYYYNASNQKTVWHKPQNCDIIPLAKLQTMRHDEASESQLNSRKESIGTQTASKICIRNSSGNPNSRNCASTQTTPPQSPSGMKHSRHRQRSLGLTPSSPLYANKYSSNPACQSASDPYHHTGDGGMPMYMHSHVARSHDSGRSSDSSSISQSQGSLDGASYVSQRKLDSCSNESINSAHSPSRHGLKDTIETYDLRAYKSGDYVGQTPSKPIFGDTTAPMRQHSFELQRTPPAVASRQYSADASLETRGASQFWIPSSGRNRSNTTINSSSIHMGKLSQQTHAKHHAEDYPLSQRHVYANAPPAYFVDGNGSYFPESMCTPLSNRRQWQQKTAAPSVSGSHQMPMESNHMFLSAEYPGTRHGRTSSDLSPHSLDLSLHDLDSRALVQPRGKLNSQHKCVSELAILSPRLLRNSGKRMPREREPISISRDAPDVVWSTRYHDYNPSRMKNESRMSNQNEAPVPSYSNLEYASPWECRTDNRTYMLGLQDYLLEQAKLSGCKLADMMNDDRDSYSQSDDSDGPREDDDDFADDEGMSHQDSSSQEYLDNYRFFDEDFDEDSFYTPIVPTSKQRTKSSQEISDASLRRDNGGFSSSSAFLRHPSHPLSFSSPQYASCCPKSPQLSMASPLMEKSRSFQADLQHGMSQRPFSVLDMHGKNGIHVQDHVNGTHDEEHKRQSKDDIEKYAEDNLNRHKKGIFRKKFTIQDMLSWSKDPIRKQMIMTTDKSLKRDACEIFKLIQIYMLDHKTKTGQTYEAVILDITTRGWNKQALRDELYIQICRQTTDNPKRESLILGWELMAVCLTFFPPSIKFHPYLEGYVNRHRDSAFDTSDLKISHYASICAKRLDRIAHKGAARSLRKPSIEEIEQSRLQIFRTSMFGSSLKEVMALQKARYPGRRLPWIQTMLSEAVLQLNGAQTEGIFRVPGDIDEVNSLKLRIDQWEVAECSDPHVPASLLKQWYRELFKPLIPDDYYNDCISYCNDPEASILLVRKLPEINRLVFSYLIRFLQVFAADENCAMTKMDANNLAMVMAPNCLRCMAEDPRIMFENTKKEMAFIKTLIQHLDTSYMEGIM